MERRVKTAKMLGEVGYLSFLSIDVEFREDWSDYQISVKQG